MTWREDIRGLIEENWEVGEEFDLEQIYAREAELAEHHPDNAVIRATIRLTLQKLRDEETIEFLGGGRYRRLR